MSDIQLSTAQMGVVEMIMQWYTYDKKQTFALAGYAGTGKTTMAKFIAESINGETLFVAYTGKAANVLREKGCDNCSTIHGAIYRPVGKDKTGHHDEKIDGPRFVIDRDAARARFADLIIVDEYSMLNEKVRYDLESFGKKILYLGDPFQLPPVEGFCYIEPDVFIEEVHRQALDSPILKAATDVREGKKLSYSEQGAFIYQPQAAIGPDAYYEADQVIVGYNKTRKAFNDRFRLRKNFHHMLPRKGDKMICLKNNAELGLFNGMIGTSTKDAVKRDHNHYSLWFDDIMYPVWINSAVSRPPQHLNMLEMFDFGYAITCHKSQGSEFNDVLIYDQPIGDDDIMRARWRYTAITRCKDTCVMVQPK